MSNSPKKLSPTAIVGASSADDMKSGGMRTISWSRFILVIIAVALLATTIIWLAHTASDIQEIESELVDYQDSVSPVERINIANNKNWDSTQEAKEQVQDKTHSSDKQVSKYKTAAEHARDEGIALLKSRTGWSKSGGDSADGKGIVYRKSTTEWGTVFKLEGIVKVNASILYDDMITKTDQVPNWNPAVLKEYVLERIDNSTDVTYNVAASGGGGWISSRDFVYARHWERREGWLVISSISVKHPSAPVNTNYVRGQQNPTIFRMKELKPGTTRLEWLLSINLNGYIPSSVVNGALSGAMVTFLKDLRKHAAGLPT